MWEAEERSLFSIELKCYSENQKESEILTLECTQEKFLPFKQQAQIYWNMGRTFQETASFSRIKKNYLKWPELKLLLNWGILRREFQICSDQLFLRGILRNDITILWSSVLGTETVSHEKWVTVFKILNEQNICFPNLVKLCEFLLSSPGTSALVESMSLVMNIWSLERIWVNVFENQQKISYYRLIYNAQML